MKIEMVHPVTDAENELAADPTPEGIIIIIIIGVDDSPGGLARCQAGAQ
jgi:hypothetical protein